MHSSWAHALLHAQALGERIKPVLTVNKLDRCFLELMLDGEEAFNGFRRVIESANVIMATYADELLGDTQVGPEKGTVSFSAGLHGWAFTLTVFAKIYAKKFGVEVRLVLKYCAGSVYTSHPFFVAAHRCKWAQHAARQQPWVAILFSCAHTVQTQLRWLHQLDSGSHAVFCNSATRILLEMFVSHPATPPH